MDEYSTTDLCHLLPVAQKLARLPADEHIQRIRADRWIGYPRAVNALNRLETLYAWPGKQRMPNLLLVGPTNNGKSMIIEKFRRTHPASSDADQEYIPVLVVQMPSEPLVLRFYVALLAAMGAPLRPRPRLPEIEQQALTLLRKIGVRVLVIDELHNILAGNSVNRREFLNLCVFSVTNFAYHWLVSARVMPTWLSVQTTSWKTGSSLLYCRYGRPVRIAVRCWPVLLLRFPCGGHHRLPHRIWPVTCWPVVRVL